MHMPLPGWLASRAVGVWLACVCLSSTTGSPLGPLDAQPLPILVGDGWSYAKGTAEPPVDWAEIGFDDGAWPVGPSGFGYGDGDDATVLADMYNGYLTVYTRRAFLVPDPAVIAALELEVDWDDGFIAYLNGQEVARANLAGAPGTPVGFDIPASNHEAGTPETFAVSPALLVAGTNVLAVQGHNARLDSSDLSLIVELRALNPPPGLPAAVSPPDGASGVALNPTLCVTVSDPNLEPLTATFHGRALPDPPTADFTVIAVPDTQYYSASYPATYQGQTQWIVDERQARNIVFVTQLGDCVDQGGVEAQWANADAAWSLVEDPLTTGLVQGIPFGIAVGNHDQAPAGDPGTLAEPVATTPLFNQYFGSARFAGREYYGGHHAGGNDNHYGLFSAAGMDFIVIHMEYMPADTALRQDVLAWADSLLSAYADRRAIVTAHYLLNPSDASFSNQGQATWDALKHNHNLFLMLCGHLDQANRRYDEYTDAFGTTRTHTLVSDYQSRPNGGNGWLRILTFSPDSDTIEVETYSPTLGTFIDNHADNTAGVAQNRFTLAYDMAGGAPFEAVGAASGPSGTELCAPWPARTAGTTYEWYVVVSDGASSTTSPSYIFTTTTTCSFPADCDDGSPCTDDTCTPEGTCENTPLPDCCASGTDCADGNPCTDDVCDGSTCSNPDNTDPCDDGDGCTVQDACSAGTCAGLPSTCDDTNPCTADSCSDGICSNLYAPYPGCCTDSDQCDDAVLCSADSCVSGTCINAPEANCCDSDPQCADGDPCTADTCSPLNAAALSFNGTSAYVTMGSATGLGAASFTLECWFKWTGGGVTTSTGTSGLGSAIPLVTKGRGEAEGSSVDMNYFLGIQGGMLAADFEEGPGGTGPLGLNHPVVGTTAITTGVWHHAAATYDGTTWSLFLDGALDATLSVGQPTRADSVQHFGVGTAMTSAGAAAGFFAGIIDEVRVWSHARSQAEIVADMPQEVLAAPGLIGRWGLNEGAGGTAADSTTPAENGTLVQAVWELLDVADLGGGTCIHAPIPDCCQDTESCDDGDACTTDVCEGNLCGHAAVPDCCLTSVDCDDLNPCTDDGCDTGTQTCSHLPNVASCDDFNGCTAGDICSAGACIPGAPVSGCCSADADCDDGLACTADQCPVVANLSALTFDGADDRVTMGAAPGLASAQFTLECWFYWTGAGATTTTGTGGLGSAIPLVSKGRGEAEGSNVDMNYFLGIQSGKLAADFEEGPGGAGPLGQNHPIVGLTMLTTNLWHHAAATYDGTTWRLYLDGVADGSLAVGQPARGDSIQHFGIGTALTSAGAAAGFFAGRIDEVRVWDHARTSLEIQSAMHRALDSGAGLLGRWGMDEGAGTAVADSTIPAEDGALSGATWITAGLPDLGEPNTCQNVQIIDPAAGCCASAADCADGDPCTEDVCSASGCANPPIGGCAVCTDDLDCDDLNECTSDSCSTANDAAVVLNGTSQYLTMGTASGLGASTFTIEAWFRRTAAGTTTSTGNGGVTATPLVTKGRGEADGDNRDMNYFLGIDAGGRLAADYEEAAGQASPGLNHPVLGVTAVGTAWTHGAATFDGTTWRLYLDGNLDATLVVGPNRLPRADSIQHFGVGSALTSSGAAAGFFAGAVDEVRVWNYARSLAEIQSSMHVEIDAAPGLIGRWGLNEASGTAAGDSTFPAEPGTLVNGAAWSIADLPSFGNDLCTFATLPPGTSCSDDDPCTIDDVCGGSICAGIPLPVPAEVSGLSLDGTAPTTVTWNVEPGAVAYDVVSGLVEALHADGGIAAADCLAGDVASPSAVDGRSVPAQDEAYYYLVSGQNACGRNGTFGYDSSGQERMPAMPCP